MDGRKKGLLLVDGSRDAEVVASLRVGYSRKDMTSFPLTKLPLRCWSNQVLSCLFLDRHIRLPGLSMPQAYCSRATIGEYEVLLSCWVVSMKPW
jgi:hypothetical protein